MKAATAKDGITNATAQPLPIATRTARPVHRNGPDTAPRLGSARAPPLSFARGQAIVAWQTFGNLDVAHTPISIADQIATQADQHLHVQNRTTTRKAGTGQAGRFTATAQEALEQMTIAGRRAGEAIPPSFDTRDTSVRPNRPTCLPHTLAHGAYADVAQNVQPIGLDHQTGPQITPDD